MVSEELVALLACPVCRAPLRLEGQRLVCSQTQVAYPIEDDIPILLAERAEPVHPDDSSQAHASPA
jgi:hypothetical protein